MSQFSCCKCLSRGRQRRTIFGTFRISTIPLSKNSIPRKTSTIWRFESKTKEKRLRNKQMPTLRRQTMTARILAPQNPAALLPMRSRHPKDWSKPNRRRRTPQMILPLIPKSWHRKSLRRSGLLIEWPPRKQSNSNGNSCVR